MEERLYSLNDANFNTTALVTSGGVVSERFLYDPYGQVTTANGTPATPSADNAWIYLHQGGRWDSSAGMYNFRNRDFSPTLMRWTTNDPIGFGGGATNTYRYVGNGPVGKIDSLGLEEGMGHHYVQVGVATDDEILPHLSKKALENQAGSVSGPTWPRHGWSTYGNLHHSDYNKIVNGELIKITIKKTWPGETHDDR